MTSMQRDKEYRRYFGLDQRTINLWRKRKVNFTTLMKSLKKVERVGEQKKIFYETFRPFAKEEIFIDRIWNTFINHRIEVQEHLDILKFEAKKIKKIQEEVENGRKV
jgi:hypothetical protein